MMEESTAAGIDGGSSGGADSGPLDASLSTTAPEAPASLTPAPSTEAQPDPSAGSHPRDEHGRFAKRDGDAPAALSADGSTPPPTAPAKPLTDAPAAPSTEPQPFSFRSNGQRIPIEGALVEPGKGLLIPESQVGHVRQLLARGHEYGTVGQQREAQYRRDLQQARQELETRGQAEDAELTVYKDFFLGILSDPTGERLIEAVQNFKSESALLTERAARAKLEKQIAARQAPPAPEPNVEQQQQQLVQGITKGAADFLEDLKDDGSFGLLTEQDWADLMEMVKEQPGALLAEVEGEYRLDTQPLRRQADRIKRIRTEAQQQAQKLTKATEYNTKRAAPPAPQPVPVAQKPRQTVPAESSEDKYEREKRWKREVGMA